MNQLVKCTGEKANMRTLVRWNFLERHIPKNGDCILSTEMLFWIHNENTIEKLAAKLSEHFDDIRVAVYLRRQDSLALSHRKQVAMGTAASKFYGVQVRALPQFKPYMTRYFNYATKLRKWEAAFGAENIHVRRFQKRDLKGGDTVNDFFGLMGMEPERIARRANNAWSRSQLLAGLWLRTRGYATEDFKDRLKGIQDDGPLKPSRAAAERFLAHFSEENEELASKYDPNGPNRYFDEDFSNYGNTSNDNYERVEMLKLQDRIIRGSPS